MAERLFTIDEANRLIPTLARVLEEAQRATARMREVRDQLMDLSIIWGDRIHEPACEDHDEYVRFREEFHTLEERLRRASDEVVGLGAELKDVENGLVDFRSPWGSHVVYLCWRQGESKVEWWHPLDSGYSARKPLPTA